MINLNQSAQEKSLLQLGFFLESEKISKSKTLKNFRGASTL